MINVTDGADIAMGLIAKKNFFLGGIEAPWHCYRNSRRIDYGRISAIGQKDLLQKTAIS